MRNLKRILSLALAATMLMGMMVMGAGAADIGVTYTDEASITNKEAVAVASAIGVFQGNDGKFMPTDKLTRESAAKIITYLVLGKTEADALKTAAAPFKDVAADRWSAGSIAYCVGRGILAGDGQGNFYPGNEVTGTQFAKMLLVALGYKSDIESFTGANWEGNVMAAAKRPETRLTTGLNVALTAKINREQAAQMTLNTLRSETVSYSGGASVPVGNGEYVTVGATRDFSGSAFPFMKDNYPNLTRTASNSAEGVNYGRPSVQWKLGKDNIGKFPVTANAVLEGKKTAAEVSSELGAYLDITSTLYVDGKSASIAHSTAANIAALTANGRTIEFYENAITYAIDYTVVIDTYSATVESINTVAKTATLQMVSTTSLTNASVAGTKVVKSSDNKELYEQIVALGKDAVVNVTFNNSTTSYTAGNIATVTEPETATGTYTKKNADNTYVFGGESYKMSVHAKSDALTLGTEYTLYLDTMGNIINFKGATAAAAKYGFVANTDVTGSASTTDGRTFKALLVYNDGTQEWVKVSKLNMDGSNTETKLDNLTADQFSTLIKGQVAKYVEKASSVELAVTKTGVANISTMNVAPTADTTYFFGNAAADPVTGPVISKNTVKFMSTDGTAGTAYNVMGSDKTIFLVKDSKGAFTAYTGVKNIPGWKDAAGFVLVGKDTMAANLVVITNSSVSASKSLAYIVDGDSYSVSYDAANDVNVYTYSAIVNGEQVDFATSGYLAMPTGLYHVTGYNGDYVSSVDVPSTVSNNAQYNSKVAVVNGTGLTITNGTITTGGASYVSADNVKITAIDSVDHTVNTGLKGTDVKFYDNITNVTLLKDSDGFITDIVFVYTPNP